jgi:hypothetical protein
MKLRRARPHPQQVYYLCHSCKGDINKGELHGRRRADEFKIDYFCEACARKNFEVTN